MWGALWKFRVTDSRTRLKGRVPSARANDLLIPRIHFG